MVPLCHYMVVIIISLVRVADEGGKKSCMPSRQNKIDQDFSE